MKSLLPLNIGEGERRPFVIAGPCSAETPEQVLETAHALAAEGIKVFRAGLWKPRTKPGGFEGVGNAGLEWLQQVKAETGMLVATEVATGAHVKAAIDADIDVLWVGARTTANPFAVQEIAEAIGSQHPDTPVLVKNPPNPDLELWLGALERLYNAGVRRLGAVHRGFSAYGDHPYRNMPHWSVPIELRRRLPLLPLLHDPSHVGGRRNLVSSLAQQALDMDFDGLMIESHCDPDCALSDSAQQLTPTDLGRMIAALVCRGSRETTGQLNELRQQLDYIDSELVEILGRRMAVSRQIGQYKKEHSMPVFQVERHDDVMRSRLKIGAELGLDEEFMRAVLRAIHEESVRLQVNILNSPE